MKTPACSTSAGSFGRGVGVVVGGAAGDLEGVFAGGGAQDVLAKLVQDADDLFELGVELGEVVAFGGEFPKHAGAVVHGGPGEGGAGVGVAGENFNMVMVTGEAEEVALPARALEGDGVEGPFADGAGAADLEGGADLGDGLVGAGPGEDVKGPLGEDEGLEVGVVPGEIEEMAELHPGDPDGGLDLELGKNQGDEGAGGGGGKGGHGANFSRPCRGARSCGDSGQSGGGAGCEGRASRRGGGGRRGGGPAGWG